MYVFFMNNTHKTKSLGRCDELPNGCSPSKEKILGAWVIPTQKYVSSIFCIIQVFSIVCGILVMQSTYVIV
jgi:hypothetical protein